VAALQAIQCTVVEGLVTMATDQQRIETYS